MGTETPATTTAASSDVTLTGTPVQHGAAQEITMVHGHGQHRFLYEMIIPQMQAAGRIGAAPFENPAAVEAWFRANNPAIYRQQPLTGIGRDCDGNEVGYDDIIIARGTRVILPPNVVFVDQHKCRISMAAVPAPVTAAAPAHEAPAPAPAAQGRDPIYAFPEHASPDDFNDIRAGFVAGVLPMDPPDGAARGQVTRGNAAGTWAGPGGGVGSTIEGTSVATFALPGLLFGGPVGALITGGVGFVARQVSVNSDDTTYQRGQSRQPYDMIIRGWTTDPDGTFRRIDPNENRDQSGQTQIVDGLSSLRLTLSTHDRNWDSMTRARVSQALEAPNSMAGILSIRGLSAQTERELAEFRRDPANGRAHAQRALDLIAAAAKTDFAQVSGLTSDFTTLQSQILAEARTAGVTTPPLRQYVMDNPDSIPALADYQPPVHPLIARSYAEICNDPGFPGNEITEAQYNERFAGRNFDSVYQRAIGGQNEFKRRTALGFSESPESRAEVDRITTEGIAVINRSPESRAAFLAAVRQDPKFGRLIGEEIADWIHHPETHGFTSRDAAIARANDMLGEAVVRSEILDPSTDVPEGDSPGRLRSDRVIQDAFVANANDAEINEYLTHVTTYPQDSRNANTNHPGVGGRAILHQLAVQGGTAGARSTGPAFTAIAAANPPLDPAAREAWLNQVNSVANYLTDVYRGSERRYSTNELIETQALAGEALSEGPTRRVVNPDGTAVTADARVVAAQAGRDLVNTGVTDVGAVQTAEVTQGREAATLTAVRSIMQDRGRRNVALEAMAMYDRPTALSLIVGSMAESPRAFERVLKSLRDSDGEGMFGFMSTSQQERLANHLETAAQRMRSLYERGNPTPAEIENAMRDVNAYVASIEAQARPDPNRVLFMDESGRLREPRNSRELAEVDRAQAAVAAARASGALPEGAAYRVNNRGEVEVIQGREGREVARDGQREYARQYGSALVGQDSIVSLMQMISLDPDANAVMSNNVNRGLAALSADQSARALRSVQAAGSEQSDAGRGNERVRDRVQDIAADQASGDPARTAASINGVTANAGGASRAQDRLVQANPTLPYRDLGTMLLLIIGASIDGGSTPSTPEEPQLPPVTPPGCQLIPDVPCPGG